MFALLPLPAIERRTQSVQMIELYWEEKEVKKEGSTERGEEWEMKKHKYTWMTTRIESKKHHMATRGAVGSPGAQRGTNNTHHMKTRGTVGSLGAKGGLPSEPAFEQGE